MNRKRRKICFVIFCLITIMGIIFSPIFSIRNLTYNLNVNFREEDIYRLTKIEKGKTNILFLNKKEFVNSLSKHPYIESIQIKKELPSSLRLDIKYREMYGILKYSDLFIVIDKNLNVLSVDKEKADGILIDGFILQSFIVGNKIEVENTNILKEALNLIELLEKSHIEFRPIILYKENNIQIQLNDDFSVKFGRGEDTERKFNNFIDIYDNLKGKNISRGIIDVSNHGLPLYKPFGD